MYQPTFNKSKFEALMLYLADANRDSETFGLTKLSKLLYYCDFKSFVRNGESITGAEYAKEEHGPIPKMFYRTIRDLETRKVAQVEKGEHHGFSQERLVSLVSTRACEGHFSEAELAVIHEMDDRMKHMTAKQVSDYSHGEVGWIVAEDRETIPYESAYFVSLNDKETLDKVNAATARWIGAVR